MATTRYTVQGTFINANGVKQEFTSMKLFSDRTKAIRYDIEVARKLREEGCTKVRLSTKSI